MGMVGTMRAVTIGRKLGRSEGAIVKRCRKLGIAVTKDGVVTSGVAAQITGLSPQYLTRLARQGRIPARRVPGGRWWCFARVDLLPLTQRHAQP